MGTAVRYSLQRRHGSGVAASRISVLPPTGSGSSRAAGEACRRSCHLFAVASQRTGNRNTHGCPSRDSHDQRFGAYRDRACKANFLDGQIPSPGTPTERFAVEDPYGSLSCPRGRAGAREWKVDWEKIRPIGQIVECFLQVRSLLKNDLTETVVDSDSLCVAWPVLPLRGPRANPANV
jgi:hypothetical protein